MKLLLDQNISRFLAQRISSHFPNSAHVSDFALDKGSDSEVWKYASENEFIIVSKDSDFHQRSFLEGAPPKVIWIRRGNCSTSEIEELLAESVRLINEFVADEEASFLILD